MRAQRGRGADFIDIFDSFYAMKSDQSGLCRRSKVQVPFV